MLVILHPVFQWIAGFVTARGMLPPAWFVTRLDAQLSPMPHAAWVYVSWYPAAALVLLAERDTFRRAYLAYAISFTTCLIVFMLFPITIERPSVGATGLSAILLEAIYRADRPVNLFPSFHAAIATVVCHLRPPSRILRGALVCWMTGICVACVLTKQHYVADVVGGVALGRAAWWAVKFRSVRARREAPKAIASSLGTLRAPYGMLGPARTGCGSAHCAGALRCQHCPAILD
jgi:hypothetical protein